MQSNVWKHYIQCTLKYIISIITIEHDEKAKKAESEGWNGSPPCVLIIDKHSLWEWIFHMHSKNKVLHPRWPPRAIFVWNFLEPVAVITHRYGQETNVTPNMRCFVIICNELCLFNQPSNSDLLRRLSPPHPPSACFYCRQGLLELTKVKTIKNIITWNNKNSLSIILSFLIVK